MHTHAHNGILTCTRRDRGRLTEVVCPWQHHVFLLFVLWVDCHTVLHVVISDVGKYSWTTIVTCFHGIRVEHPVLRYKVICYFFWLWQYSFIIYFIKYIRFKVTPWPLPLMIRRIGTFGITQMWQCPRGKHIDQHGLIQVVIYLNFFCVEEVSHIFNFAWVPIDRLKMSAEPYTRMWMLWNHHHFFFLFVFIFSCFLKLRLFSN